MSSLIVFDASVILTLIYDERGVGQITEELLRRSVCSAVNMAEVQTKLVRESNDTERVWHDARAIVRDVYPFTDSQAKLAGSLVAITRPYGLSLGDRACLALAIELDAAVYTTDRIWENLKLDIPIHIIR